MNTSITTLRIGASLILALSSAAFANDLPVRHDHAANPWIRMG